VRKEIKKRICVFVCHFFSSLQGKGEKKKRRKQKNNTAKKKVYKNIKVQRNKEREKLFKKRTTLSKHVKGIKRSNKGKAPN